MFSDVETHSYVYHNPELGIPSCRIIIDGKIFEFKNIQEKYWFCKDILKKNKKEALWTLEDFFQYQQNKNTQAFTIYHTFIKKNNSVTVLPYQEELGDVFVQKSK